MARDVRKPLARMPLQIGTAATWSAGRAAATLFPGCASLGAGIVFLSTNGEAGIWPVLAGGLLVPYAGFHLYNAIKTRASDVLLYPDGVYVDGGRLHGTRVPWSDIGPPFAEVEVTSARRLTMLRMFFFLLSLALRSRTLASPVEPVTLWRLWLVRKGRRELVAETEREIEAESMEAAAASIRAVEEGRRFVAEAPAVRAQVATCFACGAPVIPDDAPAVPCRFCRQMVPLGPEVRGQAAAAKAMAKGRERSRAMVAKLVEQPSAGRSNGWLLVVTMFMLGAWPLGWALVGARLLLQGAAFDASSIDTLDAVFFALPFAAVFSGFFFARGRLADRGALQMLTLGFGALAPVRAGEPSRCRRCQAPLPDEGAGGVAQCLYCHADNVVGLDMRPTVDQHRAEEVTFDVALKNRARERALWATLTIVSGVTLLGWLVASAAYVAGWLSL